MSTKRKNIPVEGMPPYPYTDAETRIPPRRNRDERMGWKKPVAAVTTLAALGVGGFMLSRGGGEEPSKTPDRPVATASVDPTPTEAPTTEPTHEAEPELEIKPVTVEQYPNAGDAAVALQDLIEDYVNSGAWNESTDEYSTGDPEFVDTIFGPAPYDSRMERIIKETYAVAYTNYATDSRNGVAVFGEGDDYRLRLENKDVEVVSQKPASAVVRMTVWAEDNARQLILDAGFPLEPGDGELPATMTERVRGEYTLEVVAGRWIIKDLAPIS